MEYRRATTPGVTYFFTVVTYNRQRLFKHPDTVQLLREAFRQVKQRHPFTLEAMVVLPEHLHCLWTLPIDDANFSTRWRSIKAEFSRRCPQQYKRQRSLSRLKKQEQAVWQRRFWEHQVRDEADFQHYLDYIHYNPVGHQLVESPKDWPYSSFRRYVSQGWYSEDWGANGVIELAREYE
jgi:putative transposase